MAMKKSARTDHLATSQLGEVAAPRRTTGVKGAACCLVLASLSVLLVPGCNSQAIRAPQLPAKYQAAARDRSSVMDLSRISSPGVSDSLIGPRDLLKITLASGRNGEKPEPAMIRVATDGTVDVPLVGLTRVSGMEAYEASQAIARAAVDRGIYVHPYVTVEMAAKAVKRITVLGAVKTPGVHELPYNNSDLVTALAAAGGLTEEAGTEVEIIRQHVFGSADGEMQYPSTGGQDARLASYKSNPATEPLQQPSTGSGQPQVLRLDLSENHLGPLTDTRLDDRDIVKVIPRKDDVIFVTGLVNTPGQYEMPLSRDVHLLDAIAMAGGPSSPVAEKVIVIRRVSDRSEPVLIGASLSKAKRNGLENIRIAPGDTVSLEQTPATVIVDTLRGIFRVSIGLAGRATVF